MNITANNDPIKQQTTHQKIQSYVNNVQNHQPFSIKKVNPVSESIIEQDNNSQEKFEVERYVRMLKNLVIPPETRKDVAVLIELELKSNIGISVADLQMLIDQVEREEKTSKEK